MKLEVVVIPVSDVDRAKRFYGGLGWRLDADFPVGDAFRVVQFTPPGSPCSVHFGKGLTSTVPGSAKGNYLVVSDIEAAHSELVGRGVGVSEVFHRDGPGQPAISGPHPRTAATPRTPRSAIPTATSGCCRRSPSDSLAAWKVTRPTHRRPSSLRRCGARRPRTASTRSGGRPARRELARLVRGVPGARAVG
jgi:catechol 2,3-dioxygenase-like lactoylglutathione lyase family enzyme